MASIELSSCGYLGVICCISERHLTYSSFCSHFCNLC